MLKKMLILMIVSVFVVAGCSSENSSESSEAIAIVNGENILKSDYETSLERLKETYLTQGIDLDSSETSKEDLEMIQEQLLNQLIDKTLLNQLVSENNVVVSNEQIETELAQIKTGFPDEDQFNAALTANNLTLEQLQAEISEYLKVENYISSQAGDLSVSDEEIKEYYDSVAGEIEDAPKFEEVKPQIEDELMNQKLNQAEQKIVEEKRSNSTIEIL